MWTRDKIETKSTKINFDVQGIHVMFYELADLCNKMKYFQTFEYFQKFLYQIHRIKLTFIFF